MYRTFFRLTKDPFSMSADPEFLMQTRQHREALAGLTYAILGRRGISVLAGDVGTGKTTILTKVLQLLGTQGVRTSVILNPTLNSKEFLEAVMFGFGIELVPESKAQRLRTLEAFLVKTSETGKLATLIVDEAHLLSPALLEEIRLLGNIEFAHTKLLQIVLLGQNELDELLNRDSLRQFKQRIALRFSIGPLSGAEVAAYIEHRWSRGGGTLPVPFSPEALKAVQSLSKGIPRVINALCDNALLLAFGQQTMAVTREHVEEAALDLHLIPTAEIGKQASAAAPMVAPGMASETRVSAASTVVVPPASRPVAGLPAAATAITRTPTPAVEAPESHTGAPSVVAAQPFRTFEQFQVEPQARSLFSRCAGWLGLAH